MSNAKILDDATLLCLKLADRLENPNKGFIGASGPSGPTDSIFKCRNALKYQIGYLMIARRAPPDDANLTKAYATLTKVLGINLDELKEPYRMIRNRAAGMLGLPETVKDNPILNSYIVCFTLSNIIDILNEDSSECKKSERLKNLIENKANDGLRQLDLNELRKTVDTTSASLATQANLHMAKKTLPPVQPGKLAPSVLAPTLPPLPPTIATRGGRRRTRNRRRKQTRRRR